MLYVLGVKKMGRNPVAKFNNEFNKPKTFRDRKKNPSKKQQREELEKKLDELHHPAHQPYERDGEWKKEVKAVVASMDVDDDDAD